MLWHTRYSTTGKWYAKMCFKFFGNHINDGGICLVKWDYYECKMAQSKWVIISYPNCIILCALEKEDSQCGKKDMQMSNEFK